MQEVASKVQTEYICSVCVATFYTDNFICFTIWEEMKNMNCGNGFIIFFFFFPTDFVVVYFVIMRCRLSELHLCKLNLMTCSSLRTAVEGVLGVCIEPDGYLRTRRWL